MGDVFRRYGDVDFEREPVRELVGNGRKLHTVFGSESTGSASEKNSSVLFSCAEEEVGGLLVARVPLLFRNSVEGSIEKQEYKTSSTRR